MESSNLDHDVLANALCNFDRQLTLLVCLNSVLLAITLTVLLAAAVVLGKVLGMREGRRKKRISLSQLERPVSEQSKEEGALVLGTNSTTNEHQLDRKSSTTVTPAEQLSTDLGELVIS